jgi:hypothetical protein
MKEKIFSQLKAAVLINGKTSISDKTLNAYVDILVAQISEESQIASAIIPYVAALKEVQSNINSVASQSVSAKEAEIKAAKDAEDAKKAEEARNKAEAAAQTEIPDWQKAIEGLTKTVAVLTETVSGFTTERTQQTISQKLTETLKSKGVPEWYSQPAIDGRTFKDDAEATAYSDALCAKWESTRQELANQGFSDAKPPASGGGVEGEGKNVATLIDQGTKTIVESKK